MLDEHSATNIRNGFITQIPSVDEIVIQRVLRYTKLMATFSIRLDGRIASAVDRIAAKTGKTKSEIVREALAGYVEEVNKKSASERPYDKMAPYIGSWDSGGMQLSTRTGEKFTEMLLKERDERRRADRRRSSRRVVR